MEQRVSRPATDLIANISALDLKALVPSESDFVQRLEEEKSKTEMTASVQENKSKHKRGEI